MNLYQIAQEIFPAVFCRPVPVLAYGSPVTGGAPLITGPMSGMAVVREIDALMGELLMGKRKKDVEEDVELDDEEEDEDDDDLDDEDDFDDEDEEEDDEEFEEEFEDDELDDDDDDIFYDDDDDE